MTTNSASSQPQYGGSRSGPIQGIELPEHEPLDMDLAIQLPGDDPIDIVVDYPAQEHRRVESDQLQHISDPELRSYKLDGVDGSHIAVASAHTATTSRNSSHTNPASSTQSSHTNPASASSGPPTMYSDSAATRNTNSSGTTPHSDEVIQRPTPQASRDPSGQAEPSGESAPRSGTNRDEERGFHEKDFVNTGSSTDKTNSTQKTQSLTVALEQSPALRWFVIGVVALIVIAGVAIAGIVCGTGGCSSKDEEPSPVTEPPVSACGEVAAETKEGRVNLIFENVTSEVLRSERQALQEVFVSSYNEVSGECNGLYQRILADATMVDWRGVTPEGPLTTTSWTAVVKCSGCPDTEPLFSGGSEVRFLQEEEDYRKTNDFLFRFIESMNARLTEALGDDAGGVVLLATINAQTGEVDQVFSLLPETDSPTKAPTPSPTEGTAGGEEPAPTDGPNIATEEPAATDAPITTEPTASPTSGRLPADASETPAPSTAAPTTAPSVSATTANPTVSPTATTTTEAPTIGPTTRNPTPNPSVAPTTASPTESPTIKPTTGTPTTQPTSSATEALPTTPAPTTIVPGLPQSTLEAMTDFATPQGKALFWVQSYPNFETLPDWRKRQLFAMATYYWSFNGPSWPLSRRFQWLEPSVNECEWASIQSQPCNLDGELEFLGLLNDENLQGSMPPEVGFLTKLEELQIVDCGLEGTAETVLPPLVTESLSNLRLLHLEGNALTGSLPTSIANFPSLTHLFLQDTPWSGALPSEFGQLSYLKQLDLSNTGLTGTVPEDWGALTALEILHLTDTPVTGAIPQDVCDLPLLTTLEADCDQITCCS